LIAAQCEHSSHGEIKMHLPLKHREIAQLIAVTPQHLSLVLRQMEVEGTIRREKGWVIVRNYQRLYQPSDSQEWTEASERDGMNVDERRSSSR
jgi:predicted transcriptional regulator